MRIIIFSLLTIFVSFTSAQDVQLGFGIGKNFVFINRDQWRMTEEGLPAMHVGLTVFPARNIGVDFRAGRDASVDFYKGTELSLFGRYYIRDFYITGGLVYHTVGSNGRGGRTDAIETTLYMPALGIAFHPEREFNRHFVLELLYISGLNQKVGYETVSYYFAGNSFINIYSDINIKHVIKFSLAYYFNF